MSYAAKVLASTLRRLVTVQVVLTVAAALVHLLVTGAPEKTAAVLYGGGIVVLGTLISAWRLLRATQAAGTDTMRSMAELYIGAALRFVLALALLALGMGWIGLDPLGIIIGFALAQLGYAFNRVRTDIGLNK